MESFETSHTLIATVGLATILFFVFVLAMRYIKYKETVALAERGLLRPEPQRAESDGKDTLRWGIILVALGLALSIGLYIDSGWDLLLLIGLLPLFFGLALILIYVLTHEEKPQPSTTETKPTVMHDDEEPKQS
jgi:preprotein translocase subunit SecG